MPSHSGAGAALAPGLGVRQTPPARGPPGPPPPRGLACVQVSASHCWGAARGGISYNSFHVFPLFLLTVVESESFPWQFLGAASPGGQGLPCSPLRGCLVAGDSVLEEEGQVHQPGVEAHRHLGPHGPAAAPGQLRRARRAPAGGPACECVGPLLPGAPPRLRGFCTFSECGVSAWYKEAGAGEAAPGCPAPQLSTQQDLPLRMRTPHGF